MTVVKLLSYKRFLKFCALEYGIEVDELTDSDVGYLFDLMTAWYNCPEILWGPRGAVRIAVEKAIEEGQLITCS